MTYRDNIAVGDRVSFNIARFKSPPKIRVGTVEFINRKARPRPLYRVHLEGETTRLNLTRAQITPVLKIQPKESY